jgi:hypothetical protein
MTAKNNNAMTSTGERFALLAFVCACVVMVFFAGMVTYKFGFFPRRVIDRVEHALKLVRESAQDRYFHDVDFIVPDEPFVANGAHPGVNLVVSVDSDRRPSVKVIDLRGNVLKRWNVDWFQVWPDATHLPDADMPKQLPGATVHGAALLDNGDLVFNYSMLGSVRMDVCGNVVWRLPYRTHHSIHVDDQGVLWIPGLRFHTKSLPGYQHHRPKFREETVLQVSPDGEIIHEFSVFDLLRDNGLSGLLHMDVLRGRSTEVTGDTLHLNDVEPFPLRLEEGLFKHGDIMLSLRNIHAVLVYNSNDRKIRYRSIGRFVRQHDPDFLDGNTISVFDNNVIGPKKGTQQSRIAILDAATDELRIHYPNKAGQRRFYTASMGKHQWLDNGNVLISDSENGRAFEIDPDGTIVWEYFNKVGTRTVGNMEEVHRLPIEFSALLQKETARRCRQH